MKKVFFHSGFHSISTSIGILLIRIACGAMLVGFHGLKKLDDVKKTSESFQDPLGIGSVYSYWGTVGAEVVCAALLVLGLLSRWVSAGIVFTMIVIIFVVHSGQWDKFELPAFYLATSLALMFMGAGRISLDYLIHKNRSSED